LKLLFVASEAYPLVKTGGLADVAGSLPEVLRQNGVDVRLLLPAYGDLLESLDTRPPLVAELELSGQTVRILEARLPDTALVTSSALCCSAERLRRSVRGTRLWNGSLMCCTATTGIPGRPSHWCTWNNGDL
jgi:hypothetical protein